MNLDAVLENLAADPASPVDVAEVALCLARDEYPLVDVEGYLTELTAMAREAGRYVHGSLEARVAGLCRFLFHEMGFQGNRRQYYDPRNSYLNEVLDRRTGIPITLSAITMAVGARAGLGVVGIGLPGHFIVKAVDGAGEILFDPFDAGRLLTPGDCEALVERTTGTAFRAFPERLQGLPPGVMVQRLLGNLKHIYMQSADHPRAIRTIKRLRQLQPGNMPLIRDLGICWLHAGQPGRALDHLTKYLESQPEDADMVRGLLRQSEKEIARWN